MIISIEGADGTGKTSVASFLADKLKEVGRDVVLVREPGSTRLGELLRNIILHDSEVGLSPRTELFLYSAARSQLMEEVIIPSLNDGKLILCDRFVDSTIVYQGIAGGLGLDKVKWIMESFFGEWFPKVTFVLDSSVEVIWRRLSGLDKIESKGKDFLRRVVEGFRALKEYYPDRIVMVDSNVALEELKKTVWQKLCERLKAIS